MLIAYTSGEGKDENGRTSCFARALPTRTYNVAKWTR